MKAKLVTFDIMVRVLVDENATEEQIIELAEDKVQQMKREWAYNVVEIEDDEEFPFGTIETDK